MQTILGIYGRSYKPISVGIQIRTLCWWSHVGGIMPDGRIVESVGGQGVVITSREDFEKRYRETRVMRIACLNADMAYAHLSAQIGKRYDDKAFWGVAFATGWDDADAYQCAELIGSAIGFFNSKKLARLTPKDILKVSHDIK